MKTITYTDGSRGLRAAQGKKLRRKSDHQSGPWSEVGLLDGETPADFEELTEADIEAEHAAAETEAAYEAEVERLIRRRYSVSAELAILRQRDTKPQEFAAYNAYAEECKTQARAAVAESEEESTINTQE